MKWLAFLVILAAPWGVHASESDLVIPLVEGKEAPFTGLLVPESRFVELLKAENEVQELRAKLAVANRTSRLVEKVYMLRLKQAITPVPWYGDPTLNRWLGFGFGIAAASVAFRGAIEITAANP